MALGNGEKRCIPLVGGGARARARPRPTARPGLSAAGGREGAPMHGPAGAAGPGLRPDGWARARGAARGAATSRHVGELSAAR